MALVTDLKVPMFKVLDCDYFIHEFRQDDIHIACCESCHVHGPEIVVRPRYDEGQEKGMIDWFLGIEAKVCCRLYDYVHHLSHAWWADRAVEFHSAREDHRVQSLVAYRTAHPPTSYRKQQAAAKSKVIRCKTCEEKVTGSICDNCGTPI